MTYLREMEVSFCDSPQLDAFSRMRVSSQHTLFDANFLNGDNPNLYTTTTTGAGAASFLSNESSIELSVGTAVGDRVLRESTRYMQYLPGKSHLVLMTGVLGTPKTGVRTRMGYYDDADGYFLEVTEDGYFIVERSSVSGSITEVRVHQNDPTLSTDGVSTWSIDPMDGTSNSPSGYTLDLSKTHILIMDMQWLGVGRVRICLDMDGLIKPIHEFNHANIFDSVYIKTATLPTRYEIENIASSISSTSMKQICTSVISEGGYDPHGKIFTDYVSTAITVDNTAWTPLMSFKFDNLLGTEKFRGWASIAILEVLNVGNNPAMFQIVSNTTLTGASWSHPLDMDGNPCTDCAMLVDKSATALSGGMPHTTNYAITSGNKSSANLQPLEIRDMYMFSNPSGNQPTFTICGRSTEGTTSLTVNATWREVQG